MDPLGIKYLLRVVAFIRSNETVETVAAQVGSDYDPGELGQILTDLEPWIERYGAGDELLCNGVNPATILLDLVAEIAAHVLIKSGAVWMDEWDGSTRSCLDRFNDAVQRIEDANKPPI